ncbi:MAG: cation-translocating P-type ATPase [Thermodesulfobacteriota bacterium]|jgi:Cd2+/Zn2+-exporting ATPase|nr:MAG: cation-translocating P-type ATPase [Thermodesulfobacteriota bacterium]
MKRKRKRASGRRLWNLWLKLVDVLEAREKVAGVLQQRMIKQSLMTRMVTRARRNSVFDRGTADGSSRKPPFTLKGDFYIMYQDETEELINYREIAVLAIVPVVVGILIVASWALAYWQIGPYFLNSGFALVATLFGGFLRFLGGFKDIYNRKITVNVFVTVALIATVAVGEFRAAAIIVFIMAVAGALESYTLDKTRRSLRNLLDLSPKMAVIRREGAEVTILASEVQVGEVVIVRPGERIPVDGIVVAGAGSVNQAPITGESMPVEKFKGSEVFSGTLNETGFLEIRTNKTGEDTTLAKIVHLVEEAQNTKAPIQNIADRFTTWFLPTVLVIAVIGYFTSGDIRVAVSILLVACPCAFAIATPTAVTAGIANLARRGVLVKGGVFLELAGKLNRLLIDKTGTFTFGRPKVEEVVGFGTISENHVLRLAAIAEKFSEHPLAKAVMGISKKRGIEIPDPDEFNSEAGMGVSAVYGDKKILVGKDEFLRGKGISLGEDIERTVLGQTEQGRTAILVTNSMKVIGLIGISDEIRPETSQAIASLKAMGIQSITMLTGDNQRVAQSVAGQIGVDNFQAELLPAQKQQVVKELQEEGHLVGMIGDGINDAPALALADVGVAMGAAGTDAAIETANVTLMNDDLSGVVDFVYMSKKVLRRIKLNIFFSIIYNAVGLLLGSLGLLSPVLAVIFQEAGCITVVFSSTLLLWAKTNPLRDKG